jgi:hypothetical protein
MYTRVSPATKNRFNFSFETKDKKKNIRHRRSFLCGFYVEKVNHAIYEK